MTYGPLSATVDADILLRAIAAVETRGGLNNWPRVEKAYLPNGASYLAQGRVIIGTGLYFNAAVKAVWDSLPPEERLGLAASWSPWQIMFITAWEVGYRGRPSDLHLASVAEPHVVWKLRRIAKTGATSVRDFADAWNSGSWRDANRVEKYTADLEAAYSRLAV